MGALMICCPATGRKISVGDVDPIGFEGTPDFVSTVYCPFCGIDHRWSRADAWFDCDEWADRRFAASAAAMTEVRRPPHGAASTHDGL